LATTVTASDEISIEFLVRTLATGDELITFYAASTSAEKAPFSLSTSRNTSSAARLPADVIFASDQSMDGVCSRRASSVEMRTNHTIDFVDFSFGT
jgi:hypothetical protein